jgi:hypothetical protein
MAELPLVIDCQTCVVRLTDACSDCLVTFLYDTPVDTPVVVEPSEARVLRLLTDEGLVPKLRRRSA